MIVEDVKTIVIGQSQASNTGASSIPAVSRETGVSYSTVCKSNPKEKWSVYEQRHDNKVFWLHDNSQPHAAKPVKNYLETLKWEGMPHSSNSPDIAPTDYHLFRSMPQGLVDQRFHS
ncbi:mariner Mos1 transposase [Trichonephila clavipes]|nr:mariner Mos1 transposase [Trichonephila clavipes]